MARSVSALYDTFAEAQSAMQDLTNDGFSRDNISIVANDVSGDYSRNLDDPTGKRDVKGNEGANFGAVAGAIIGLGAMLIPGIGPVIGAGPLVAGLIGAGVGAGAGAVTGGITANLVKFGVDEDLAYHYAEGVRRGGTLLVVQTEDSTASRAESILRRHSPIDVKNRASAWRESGWSRFDESGNPLTPAEIEAERKRYLGTKNPV